MEDRGAWRQTSLGQAADLETAQTCGSASVVATNLSAVTARHDV
jgi:hypothetical protein